MAAAPASCVASPKWERVICFFTDRFASGDLRNDDLDGGEIAAPPTRTATRAATSDIDRLDYIQGLGATAIWITPPVAQHVSRTPSSQLRLLGPYLRRRSTAPGHPGHLQALSRALHRRGMYLIQDVVSHEGTTSLPPATRASTAPECDPACFARTAPCSRAAVSRGAAPPAGRWPRAGARPTRGGPPVGAAGRQRGPLDLDHRLQHTSDGTGPSTSTTAQPVRTTLRTPARLLDPQVGVDGFRGGHHQICFPTGTTSLPS